MRRVIQGYMDFGPISNLPHIVILTDRDDGTLWLLSHNTSGPDADGRISLNDTFSIPRTQPSRVYPVAEGPIVNGVRLIVRGGRLGYEPTGELDSGKVISRVLANKTAREVFMQSTWIEGQPLSWRTMDNLND